jgi:CspA family cold shock protein
MSDEKTGTIKWFNISKGFGFIKPSDGAGDVFVHKNILRNCGIEAVMEGQKVKYTAVANPRNALQMRATWVGAM